jgi:hypothetical protein
MPRTAKKAAAAPAAKKAAAAPIEEADVVETPAGAAGPTTTVQVGDPAAARAAALTKADAELAGRLRRDHVEGLRTEREFLTRTPAPNTRRIAEIDAEIDRYSATPTSPTIETA